MTDHQCARCGAIGLMLASASRGGEMVYYCHNDARSCYVLATWDGYPEMNDREADH